MPRIRALVLCALALVLGAAVLALLLGFGWVGHEPPLRGLSEPMPSSLASWPSPLPADPTDPAPAARVSAADPELDDQLARKRLYDAWGLHHVGGTRGGLRIEVKAGETKVVGHDAFFVTIRKTWGDEQAWLDVVRRMRPIDGESRTDVDGIARFDGQYLHGVIAWVMHRQTMLWRATGPVYGKPVFVEIGFGPVTLHGTVYDGNGLPRSEAVITAAPIQKPGRKEEKVTTYVGVSDELGKFELTGLPHASLRVTCLGNEAFGYREEQRTLDASKANEVRVRFGTAPGGRWWRGRVVDENGVVVVGPNDIRIEHAEGELRVETSQSDGTFAVLLGPGAWRASATRAARSKGAKPLQFVVDTRDIAHDVVLPGRQVLLRLAADDARVDLDEASEGLHLGRDQAPAKAEAHPTGEPAEQLRGALGRQGSGASPRRALGSMPGGRRFAWNGAEWYGWCGLPSDVFALGCWGSHEVVGMPEGGVQIDTRVTSPLIVDVLLRRVATK